MSKLLEAAKAVISVADSHDAVKSDGASITALRATIAAEEQRLADEQLPATKEWLEELLRLSSKRYAFLGVYGWFRHGIKLAIYDNGSIEAADSVVIENPTRRQAMTLLEAMGVKP